MKLCKSRNIKKEMCKIFCEIFVKCIEKGRHNKENAEKCEHEAAGAASISSKASTITTDTF